LIEVFLFIIHPSPDRWTECKFQPKTINQIMIKKIKGMVLWTVRKLTHCSMVCVFMPKIHFWVDLDQFTSENEKSFSEFCLFLKKLENQCFDSKFSHKIFSHLKKIIIYIKSFTINSQCRHYNDKMATSHRCEALGHENKK